MKTYTDLEQSKELMKFLLPDSADNFIADVFDKSTQTHSYNFHIFSSWGYKDFEDLKKRENKFVKFIPCWSLAALINLLPSEFTTENKFGIFKYTICIRKYKFTEDKDVYQIAYGNYKYYEDGSSSWKDMINTGEKENLIDAVFEMICWLKENYKL